MMKNLIALTLFSTAIIDLLVVTGSSFSQKTAKPPKQETVDSSVILADPRFQKFIADTAALSKKFEQAVDSVRLEHSKTEQRMKGDKELIKVQRVNFNALYELKALTSHGLEVLEKGPSAKVRSLPPVKKATPIREVQPLEVCIDISRPDSLYVPPPKKSFIKKVLNIFR